MPLNITLSPVHRTTVVTAEEHTTRLVTPNATVVRVTVGARGPRGNALLNGPSAPTEEDGINGDFWIDTNTWTIYGPKADGAWPAGFQL